MQKVIDPNFGACGILRAHINLLGGFMKKQLVLAAVIACTVPAFAFTAGQSQPDINKEVASRVDNRQSLESIADAAKKAGVVVNPIAMALTFYGSCDAVLAGLMAAGYDAAAVVNALATAGCSRTTLIATAISRGADPTTITASTAAGGNTGTSGNAGGVAGFTGFSGNSFSASRASTVGGAGRSSVSRS
jgi:hypothetical protein